MLFGSGLEGGFVVRRGDGDGVGFGGGIGRKGDVVAWVFAGGLGVGDKFVGDVGAFGVEGFVDEVDALDGVGGLDGLPGARFGAFAGAVAEDGHGGGEGFDDDGVVALIEAVVGDLVDVN